MSPGCRRVQHVIPEGQPLLLARGCPTGRLSWGAETIVVGASCASSSGTGLVQDTTYFIISSHRLAVFPPARKVMGVPLACCVLDHKPMDGDDTGNKQACFIQRLLRVGLLSSWSFFLISLCSNGYVLFYNLWIWQTLSSTYYHQVKSIRSSFHKLIFSLQTKTEKKKKHISNVADVSRL